jgi:hypothetical protein
LEDIFRGMHPVTAIREQSVQESAGIIATDRQN